MKDDMIETELGNVPKHWVYEYIESTDIKIGDGNYSSKYPRAEELLEEGIPFISSNDVKRGRVLPENLRYISEEQHSRLLKGHIQTNDVLMVVRGNGVGQVGLVSKEFDDANLNAQMAWLGRSQTIDGKFLFYLLDAYYRSNVTNTVVSGSAQPQITITNLKKLKIAYPPLPEQKAIASVLSSLDDKIDLLHRQNKTLEAMAETLFRQWFIEEAKEDWEEVPLSEVAVIQNGYAFSSRDYVEKTTDEYEVLKMGHIDKNSTLKLNPKRDYVPRKPELKKFVLNYNDIVMPMTDMKDNVVILGVPALVDASDKYVLNQRVARIYLKEDSKLSSTYYLFLQLKDPDFIARLQSTANSGVQVNLSTQAIKDCPIVIPSVEKQAEHKKDIANFYDRLSNNRKKIQILEKLRDTLLPKLMSGEVRVQYQTEEVA